MEKDNSAEQANVAAAWIIVCDGYYPVCSNCHNEPPSGKLTPYCPMCGAKMSKELLQDKI